MTCSVHHEVVPFFGHVLSGSCGERLELRTSVVLRPSDVPQGACAAFRARVLDAFGPDGPRCLARDEEPFDPASGMGIARQTFEDVVDVLIGGRPGRSRR